MYLQIDTNTAALNFDQTTQLEGREYLLKFLWLDREGVWLLGVYDQDDNPLAVGVRLVANFPLLRRFVDPRLPPGLLMVVDNSGEERDIVTPDELGARCPLLYITSDDPDLVGFNLHTLVQS